MASLHTWKHLPRNEICDLGHIRKCDWLRFQAITTLLLCGDGVFVCWGGSGVFGFKVGMTNETLGGSHWKLHNSVIVPNLKKY